jgi:hypothetical protein
VVPEHGPLFRRLDRPGQGSSALRPWDFGHRSSYGGRSAARHIHVLTFNDDGLIAGHLAVRDDVTILRQLGALVP